MADSFEFSQPIDLNVHQCCAQRLYDDTSDLKIKPLAPPASLEKSAGGASDAGSGGITPFFGILNETTPGQPLAFDTNLRKLNFDDSKLPTPPIGNNNLQFDRKFSGALIFGLHMKL